MASTSCKILTFTVTVGGVAYKAKVSDSTVSLVLPYGSALNALAPVIEISTGATVSPASAVATDFSAGPVTYTVTAEDTTTTKKYKVSVTTAKDKTIVGVHNMNTAGWFNTRCVIGNLSGYAAGGIKIDMGGFKPKYVIGVQVDKGNVGYFDLNTMRLRVYSAAGTEATADANCEFSLFLLGE